jgi:hypothetical protein
MMTTMMTTKMTMLMMTIMMTAPRSKWTAAAATGQ